MTAKIFLLVLTPFFFLSEFLSAQEENVPSIAEHYKTKKFDVAIFPASSRELFDGPDRFTPSKQDVEYGEDALINQLPALNLERHNQFETPVIDKNLSKYKRQYFGYYDNNRNRILFINCFWKRDKEENLLWLNERIMVLDGGSYFWSVKYNLNTNELFDLDVNGEL